MKDAGLSCGKGARAPPDAFECIIKGAVVIPVDPMQCIPLTLVRSLSRSGVLRLAVAFSKGRAVPGHTHGHSSGGGTPAVIELADEFSDYKYFMETKNMSEVDAVTMVSTWKVWYGICDGAHRNAALRLLAEAFPELYLGFTWYVLKINHSSLELLRAFVRERNEKQEIDNVVEFTQYDVMVNLKTIAKQILRKRGLSGTGSCAPQGCSQAST